MVERLRRAFAAWKNPAAALALAALLALAAVPVQAEGSLISALSSPAATEAPATPSAAPSPTAAPAGEEFVHGTLRLTPPAGMKLLEGDALAAYEAAAQFDFPGAAETILAATDPARGAALTVVSIDSGADCLSAAREAAEALTGSTGAVEEATIGENACARFAWAMEDQSYRLCYLSDGARLIAVCTSGLDPAEEEALLAGLRL